MARIVTQWVAPVVVALLVGGGVYGDVHVNGLIQSVQRNYDESKDAIRAFQTDVSQSRVEIITARDEALIGAKNDLSAKVKQQDEQISSIGEQALRDLKGARDERIRTIRGAASAAELEVNKAAMENKQLFEKSSAQAWKDAETTGLKAIDIHQRRVGQQFDKLLGVLPARVHALDSKLDELKAADSHISALLASRARFDKPMTAIDAMTPGGNLSRFLTVSACLLALTSVMSVTSLLVSLSGRRS